MIESKIGLVSQEHGTFKLILNKENNDLREQKISGKKKKLILKLKLKI